MKHPPDDKEANPEPPCSWITDPLDILKWCKSQGVTPMPCIWGTKKAVRDMWKSTLEKQGHPDCGGFLVDHPARRAAIERFWKTHEHPHKQMNNISLVTSWNGICSIDCDIWTVMRLAETLLDAPKVLSKKGGKFILRLIGDAPAQVQYAKEKPQKGKKPSVGLEFFSRGKHVLIYGMHPDLDANGKPVFYKFYPKPIPSMTWDQIYAILIRIANQSGLPEEITTESRSKERIEPDVITNAYIHNPKKTGQSISDWFNLPYPQPINSVKTENGLQGTHPVHGSTGGKNFSVTNDGTFYCFRHGVGGDRFLWFLIENHIIECEQAEGGWKGLTPNQQEEARNLLKSKYPERYEEFRKLSHKIRTTKKRSGATETIVESLPDRLPDHHITLLNGLARIGKSTFGVKCLLDAGQGLFIANTHSIMEHAMRLMKDMWTKRQISDRTAVAIGGKQYCCNDEQRKGRCNGCPKAPKNPQEEYKDKPGISILALNTIVLDLLQKNKMLTKDNIPPEYCPYYILMHAHDQADFVFLVPFFSSVDDETRRVEPKENGLAVIDEGPTCDHYRTPCVEIALYRRLPRGRSAVEWNENIPNQFILLKEYVTHRLDDEDGKPSSRMPKEDSIIISVIEKFLPVYDILAEFNNNPTSEGFQKANKFISAIDFGCKEYPRELKTSILRKVEEYAREAGLDSNAINEIFVVCLYPGLSLFSWQGDNPKKLFMISNDSLYLIPDFGKLLVIGASQGRRFVRDYAAALGITDISEIYVTGFPYAQNYIIFALTGASEDKLKKLKEKDEGIDQANIQRVQFDKFIRAANKHNNSKKKRHGSLLITASKDTQDLMHKRLKCGSTLVTNHSTQDIRREVYLTGNIGIYTQNSCISRGIDVPFIDRVYFNPGGFAAPAITARIQYLKDQKDEPGADIDALDSEIEDLWAQWDEIQSDEITNNVLRTAPIPGDPNSLIHTKVIVMRQHDYEKLDDRIKALVEVVPVDDDTDPKLILEAMDSIHRAVVMEKNKSEVEEGPNIPLSEQRERLRHYLDYHVQCIDRSKLPYKKVIKSIANQTAMLNGKRMTKAALIKNISRNMGTHVSKEAILQCILLGLADRHLIDERADGKIFYRLHPNVIAYVSGGIRRVGPDYPGNLSIFD
jgi:hypothetical protein